MMYDREKEINEAMQAGERALMALNDAERYLDSARGFGIWDMLGGGFVSSMIKHSKMDEAQRSIEKAQYELQNFSRELRDVQMRGVIQINFDGLTKFVDVFCDNFLVDVLVQSKIKEAQGNIAIAKQRVQDVIYQLHNM